ncbi:AraC family transcriptional regulator [Lentzea sp. BCCO 10_0856]|uniref:AraC family transcriptional regulator n=1 Tax=Lentzea miocenica TaxID=3095431 RepID=A0ABU4T474_9PSEU|nr:AraC family transcriptional regulator [Lentzea sp. BCCO 10_0856]MDX8032951.1 AraC family transcriptional regulator [Lentzea sp. BCCO 10_0856]
MEAFDELLRGVRADGAGVRRVEVSGTQVLSGLTLYAVAAGEMSVLGETAKAGDIVVVQGSVAAEGHASVVSGTYDAMGAVARRLTAVLPDALVAPGSDECAAFYDAVGTGAPGVVTDRLLDWLMVCALREWFDRAHSTGWMAARADVVVGPVLQAMHASPARAWTLALLAKEAGVARTTLATRFAKLVGVPPLTYLTDWRMAVAADLLAESSATVASVARQVGYADAFGFSAAFKRVHGFSPSECRSRCAATA